MATYYVNKSGSDSNNGTSRASAKLTFLAGVALLSAGDTLYVGEGSYGESSGSGYIDITDQFGSETFIARDPADSGEVLLTGSGSTNRSTQLRGGNLTFNTIRFSTHTSSQTYVVRANNRTGYKFIDCKFDDDEVPGAFGVRMIHAGESGAVTVTLEGANEFSSDQTDSVGIRLDEASLTDTGGQTVYNTHGSCIFSNSADVQGLNVDGAEINSTNAGGVRLITHLTSAATVIVNNCTGLSPSGQFIRLAGGSSGQLMTVTTKGNSATVCQQGIGFDGFIQAADADAISGNVFEDVRGTGSGGTGIAIGSDGYVNGGGTGTVTGFTLKNNRIIANGTNVHALLTGLQSRGVTDDGTNTWDGTNGGYAAVIKGGGTGADEHDFTVSNVWRGGNVNTAYFKGCYGASVSFTPTGLWYMARGGAAIGFAVDDAATPDAVTSNVTISGHRVLVTSGSLYDVPNAASGEIGDSIDIDNGTYDVRGTWGNVYDDGVVSSLADVRAAWDDYDISTNDDNSVEGSLSYLLGGGVLQRRRSRKRGRSRKYS